MTQISERNSPVSVAIILWQKALFVNYSSHILSKMRTTKPLLKKQTSLFFLYFSAM